MSKVLPILVVVCVALVALIAFHSLNPKDVKPKEVQGTQDQKRVLMIADSNLAVTVNGQTLEAKAQDHTLPKIYASMDSQHIKYAATLASELETSDFQLASMRILDDETITIYNQQGAVAIFSLKKDEKSQISSLQQVLAKSKISATKIQKIDLRFDKPVVAFK